MLWEKPPILNTPYKTSLSRVNKLQKILGLICPLGCPIRAGLSGPGRLPNNGHVTNAHRVVFLIYESLLLFIYLTTKPRYNALGGSNSDD